MKLSFPEIPGPSVNWFGVIAGVLMLALPLMGPWWYAAAGTGAMEIALSPFDVNISLLDQPLQSSLVGIFLLAVKISFIIAGTFMIAGSLFPEQWWSRRLVRFGVMKPFWSIVSLLIPLVVGALAFNFILPGALAGMMGGATGGARVTMQLSMPYISGTTTSMIQIGSTSTLTAPITASLTGVFWVAVVVAVLGVIARIYHRRFAPPEKSVKPEKPKK